MSAFLPIFVQIVDFSRNKTSPVKVNAYFLNEYEVKAQNAPSENRPAIG